MSRRPTIIYVNGQDPSAGKGGGSTYLRSHARAARQAGYQVHIFCVSGQQQQVEQDFGSVHRVRTPWWPRGRLAVQPGESPHRYFAHWYGATACNGTMARPHRRAVLASLERFLSAHPGDCLVHGFFTWGSIGLALRNWCASQGRSLPVVNSFYTTVRHEAAAMLQGAASGGAPQQLTSALSRLLSRYVAQPAERSIYTGADRVLINYDSVRCLLEAEYGPRDGVRKLALAPESCIEGAAGQGPARRPAAGAPLLVSVSRHDPRKGLDVLIHALAMLRDAQVPFRAMLLSGGPLFEQHSALLECLGLGDRVTMTNWVDSPAHYLAEADVFVLPSLEEGSSSLALLEAMHAGLAIVASDLDGIPEDVRHRHSALLVKPGDAGALAGALREVLSDTALRTRLGAQARADFRREHDLAGFATALSAVYCELGLPEP